MDGLSDGLPGSKNDNLKGNAKERAGEVGYRWTVIDFPNQRSIMYF